MNLHRFSFKNEARLTLIFTFAPAAIYLLILLIFELVRALR